MRITGSLFALAVCCGAVGAFAMDGVCIATIMTGPTFKYEATFGPLVKYEITADSVSRVDTLSDVNAASPRINMSGTYYAYVKATGAARTLVIKPLYGNPASSAQIPLLTGANWIWWVEDSTFFYTQNPGSGQFYVRKLKLGKVNGQLAATDRMWVRTQEAIQGGFVGLDLTGTKLSYKAVVNTYGCTVSGDSTQPPVNANIGIGGCGNSVSPSGTWWTQFPGGHAAVGWGKWDGTSGKSVWFTAMDTASWAIVQSSDPLRNLEAHWLLYGYPWMACPIGVFGTENIWSQNSEDWFMGEVGAALNGDADCINAIAINIRTSKAINISKIAPARQTFANQYNSSQTATEFRYSVTGPTFSNGVQRSADRPGLWCSSQADVSPALWHYIQNRQLDNQQWADLLGLPLSQIPVVNAGTPRPAAASPASVFVKITKSARAVVFPAVGEYSVTIADFSGRVIARSSGCGRECRLPRLQAGNYVLTADLTGKSLRAKISCLN